MLSRAQSTNGRKYTYRPPHSGHRLLLTASPPPIDKDATLPNSIDQRGLLRPVRDQGHEGDCFAFAGAALKEFNCAVWGGSKAPLGADLSPAYLAWRIRMAEGTFPSDAGASLADTMEVLRAWGVCPESFLPYRQDAAEAGDAACDVAAEAYRVALPCVVDWSDAGNVKRVLAAGKCIALGFSVYPSFEATGGDGVVGPVAPSEGLIGGHAVLVCGYSSAGWLVRNSWGTGWGAGGYCTMPYGYEEHWLEAWTA